MDEMTALLVLGLLTATPAIEQQQAEETYKVKHIRLDRLVSILMDIYDTGAPAAVIVGKPEDRKKLELKSNIPQATVTLKGDKDIVSEALELIALYDVRKQKIKVTCEWYGSTEANGSFEVVAKDGEEFRFESVDDGFKVVAMPRVDKNGSVALRVLVTGDRLYAKIANPVVLWTQPDRKYVLGGQTFKIDEQPTEKLAYSLMFTAKPLE